MADPWLAIVGLGEDGPEGLRPASLRALAGAEVIFGGPRHLDLVAAGDRGRAWPVPFSVTPVLALRGRRVAVLASGDPFWFGAGGSLLPHLAEGEWVSHPAPSTFSLAANRIGWRLEAVACHGLHAGDLGQLVPDLRNGRRMICLVRDGDAVGILAAWLAARGAGASDVHVLERLGGPFERVRNVRADAVALTDIAAPVAVAVEVACPPGLPLTPGLPEDAFAHDGQITKRAVRALTLAALAPLAEERLWDLGAGSGSVSVEWCRAGGRALAVEVRSDRVANIRANIAAFGLGERMAVLEARVVHPLPAALHAAPRPDAIFIGGGADAALLETLAQTLPGTRIVVNAVTLETEALLTLWHARTGGALMRVALDDAAPLGRMRGWVPQRPIVQWTGVL